MKVILKQDIKGVGKKDQVIEAADGYARNFLFKKGLAVPADNSNMSELKAKQDSVQYKKGLDFKEAQEYDKKLQNVTLKFELKAGSNGKVFGGVTPKDISEKLKQEYNIEVDKKNVLTDTIKNEGITTVALKLNEGVSSKVKVQVVAI
jgi:large subunit ribosomal protein L9